MIHFLASTLSLSPSRLVPFCSMPFFLFYSAALFLLLFFQSCYFLLVSFLVIIIVSLLFFLCVSQIPFPSLLLRPLSLSLSLRISSSSLRGYTGGTRIPDTFGGVLIRSTFHTSLLQTAGHDLFISRIIPSLCRTIFFSPHAATDRNKVWIEVLQSTPSKCAFHFLSPHRHTHVHRGGG